MLLRRTTLVCLEVVLGIVVLSALLTAGSAWRLSKGPVSLQFLLPYAKDLIQAEGAPVQAHIGDLILTWAGWERALDVRARDVRLRTRDGRPLMRVGEVSVNLSARALMQGVVAPTSLEVIRPRLRLTRVQGGGIDIGIDDMTSGDATAPAEALAAGASQDATRMDMLRSLLDELSGPAVRSSSLRYLNRVSVLGASIRVKDTFLDLTWSAHDADITVSRSREGLTVVYALVADIGAGGAGLRGNAVFSKDDEAVEVRASVSGVDSTALAALHPRLQGLSPLAARLSGFVQGHIGLDGEIMDGSFWAKAEAGRLSLAALERPVEFDGAEIAGRIGRDPDQIRIGRFSADLGSTRLTANGVVTRVGDIAAINASMRLDDLAVNDLARYWPPDAAKGTRAWVIPNIRDGVIGEATAAVTARIGMAGEGAGSIAVDSLAGRLAVNGATVHYLRPLPPITDGNATATFGKSQIDFAVSRGRSGGLEIDEGAVNIVDIGGKDELLNVSGVVHGSVPAALALVGHPRLDLVRRVSMATAGATGTVATRFRIGLPLLKDVPGERVSVDTSSHVTGLAIDNLVSGKGIRGADLRLDVDNRRLRADGEGLFDAAPVRFVWEEYFGANVPVVRRLSAGVTLDARLREGFGIDFRQILTGPTPAQIQYSAGRDGGQEKLSARIDLQPARLTLPGFRWTKAPGRYGTARLDATLRGGRVVALSGLNVDTEELKASGRVELSADGELARAVLERFRLGATDFSGELSRGPEGGFRIVASGTGLDATTFMTPEKDFAGVTSIPPFDFEGRFGNVWFTPGNPSRDVVIKLARGASAWRLISIRGKLPAVDKELSIDMLPIAGGHELTVYAADAGIFLKSVDVTDTIVEGTIEAKGRRMGGVDAPWKGVVEMKRFRIANAPNFARLLSLASLTGISDVVAGRGIRFSRLTLPISFAKDVVTITDGEAVGSEVGITGSGKVDFAKKAIDLQGTLVPAYTINSFIGKIPLVGDLLVGEKGGGVFAVNYGVEGPFRKPEIKVNPLSALAPGILRKLLGPGMRPDAGPEALPEGGVEW